MSAFSRAMHELAARPELAFLERAVHRTMSGVEEFIRALQRGNVSSCLTFVGGVILVIVLAQIFLRDDKVSIYHLVPSGSLCATQDDMYDDTKRLCQMGNKYAYAFLLKHDWVLCAPNMPAAKLLRSTEDGYGNFWYRSSDREEVRRFYKTCVPTCAGEADTFHSSRGACLVGSDLARVWLQGSGQHCEQGTAGGAGILRESAAVGDGNFWYKPELASRVREFYGTCRPTCALGDTRLDDRHCQVMNHKAISFLRGDQSVSCDTDSPGRSAVQGDQASGSHWYAQSDGPRVEAWYTSCMAEPAAFGGGAPPPTVAPDGQISFPYPQEASADTATLCNFSGKTYWFSSGDVTFDDWSRDQGNMYLAPLNHGEACITVPGLTCKPIEGIQAVHLHCGFVAPCEGAKCDTADAKAIQGGISVINGRGDIEWLPAHAAAAAAAA